MEHTYLMPSHIEDKESIYESLTILHHKFNKTFNSNIFLDLSTTSFIMPHLMAPLGLILSKIKSQNNSIMLTNMRSSISKILVNYGFLKSNQIRCRDIMQNYIKYKSFSGDDTDGFEQYLTSQLNDISDKSIIETLISHILEIFVNVKTHARHHENKNEFGKNEVFTSGYYNKNNNYIRFSIANNGKSFMNTIKDSLNYNFENEFEYIEWAILKKNTSKKNTPGGLGLYMLNELVHKTKGELIILSGKAYYHLYYSYKTKSFIVSAKDFSYSFPGTSVTVKFPLDSVPSGKTINNSESFDILSILKGGI